MCLKQNNNNVQTKREKNGRTRNRERERAHSQAYLRRLLRNILYAFIKQCTLWLKHTIKTCICKDTLIAEGHSMQMRWWKFVNTLSESLLSQRLENKHYNKQMDRLEQTYASWEKQLKIVEKRWRLIITRTQINNFLECHGERRGENWLPWAHVEDAFLSSNVIDNTILGGGISTSTIWCGPILR